MAFDWFKRKSKSASRPRRRLPQRHLAPVEEIVEQGLMVADVAARMTVKNEIILNALGRKANYDKQQVRQMMQDAVMELAVERERDARHISRMRGEIRKTGYSSWSENDYGSDDNATLRHRQEVYEKVAAELRERSENDEYLTQASERALGAAWNEIGDSLKERASHPYYAGGSSDEYKRERESRIELLIQRDLTDLMRQRPKSGSAKLAGNADSSKSATKRRPFAKRQDS